MTDNMKTITITVDVDGNSVTRNVAYSVPNESVSNFQSIVEDMLDTLEKSNEEEF